MNTCVCVWGGGGMCGGGRYHPAGEQRTSMNTCVGESGICAWNVVLFSWWTESGYEHKNDIIIGESGICAWNVVLSSWWTKGEYEHKNDIIITVDSVIQSVTTL